MNYETKYTLVKSAFEMSDLGLGKIIDPIKNYWANSTPEQKRAIIGSITGAVALPALGYAAQGVANRGWPEDQKVKFGLGDTLMSSLLGGFLGNRIGASPLGESMGSGINRLIPENIYNKLPWAQ
jgi:hypothetical protein